MREPEYIKDHPTIEDRRRRIVSKPNGLWQAEYRQTSQRGTKTSSPWATIGPVCEKEEARNIMNTHVH